MCLAQSRFQEGDCKEGGATFHHIRFLHFWRFHIFLDKISVPRRNGGPCFITPDFNIF